MPLFIPEDYTAKLAPETMEQAITYLKEIFPDMLARRLRLRRVTAPLFVLSGTGINDDLNGVERAVSFPIRDLGDRRAEVVHSLAKWKRMKLGTYKIAPGYGLYTDMNAIRADEELDNTHSLYVDQWDWERTIRPEERNLGFLKGIVETIYEAMKAVEEEVYELYPHITPILPERITFIQSEELLREFPDRLDGLISELSSYMESTGRSYQNHAATIRRWAENDKTKGVPKQGIPDYTCKEGESL